MVISQPKEQVLTQKLFNEKLWKWVQEYMCMFMHVQRHDDRDGLQVSGWMLLILFFLLVISPLSILMGIRKG